MKLLLIAGVLLAPAAASAKETFIRCDAKARTSGALGNYSRDETTARYYVINDTARTIAFVSNGERMPICSADAQCTTTVNNAAVVIASESLLGGRRSTTRTEIDRRSGMLNEAHQLYNEQGQPVIHTEVKGPCRSIAPDQRAF